MNKELSVLLHSFRTHSQSEREKGTYFEELVQAYLKNEPKYKELFSDVWLYSEYAQKYNLTKRDTGIDLVAKTYSDELYAIQCKFYAEDYRIQKSDIDSFFTASGKKEFSQRILISTTNLWSENAEDALLGQNPPVTKISYFDLENSVIKWDKYFSKKQIVLKPKKKLRDHQTVAISRVKSGLATEDRGKLIMACGTGKTFTSLKLTEEIVGKGKTVLFLVPSLALLSQTLTEWTQESEIPLKSFAVCSDSEIGKKRNKDSDKIELFSHELAYPSTTDAKSLGKEFKEKKQKDHLNVIFSTYHSIEVISQAQKKYELPEFDLIICDEAHRTTGATFDEEDESNFVKIHNNSFIKGKKRIYMTATPRIYGEPAKATAENSNVTLCSMDDEKLFGKNLHVLTFSESVQRGLLVDYKVIVLAVDEAHI
nr:DEAD/DEAH box helicase family protein [Leptospiraceae bacterium]